MVEVRSCVVRDSATGGAALEILSNIPMVFGPPAKNGNGGSEW